MGDADTYIRDQLLKSYEQHGFGLLVVIHKELDLPIGLCGLLKREELDHPDLGFAFLPKYEGQGFATESAKACLAHYLGDRIPKILAITLPENKASIAVLANAGMQDTGITHRSSADELKVFSISK